MRLHHVALLVFYALAQTGCDDGQSGCRGDSDCPGGACVVGQCRPLGGGDLAAAGDGGVDFAGTGGLDFAGAAADAGGNTDAAPLCTFNHDGVIDRSEAPFLVGLGGLYVANASGSTVTVDLHANNNVWDFSAPVAGDRKVFDQLSSAGGQWWSADFPTATHAQHIDDEQPVLGVYRATDTALQLLGVVSEQDGLQKTELTYNPPVDVLRFPLSTTSTWTQTSTVSGLAQGVAFAATESYTFTVDARGTTRVPAGDFDTLRLRLDYKQTWGLAVTTRISYLHLAECYGLIARIRSQDDETQADFTQAREYHRLSSP